MGWVGLGWVGRVEFFQFLLGWIGLGECEISKHFSANNSKIHSTAYKYNTESNCKYPET